ncbi:DNA polymerase III, delta subunit [Salinimicrobium catena]|uniref:DNA polymerase III subunit delta n=1 Tax=Salinimicrobium catena TaxID=390640 RepID=A0A1H5L512_9FLAO|nr:DNA polymerase III subunit delta [Salinimicrobium catena]SDL05879.1 DNA polymerase III, delta subunit [Salinimicrobium catena]SEE72219.1 DNA polymerase III, delta subunit [Salinimicrobium catena]
MDDVKNIITTIKKGELKPIYFLMGEEPYFIDQISGYIEENVLREDEKGFNQMVLYGRDVSVDDIVGNAKRFPMMAERQVIIVKEAQDLSRTIEQLTDYAENPQPSTVLVVCYKYKKLDKRKKLHKAIAKNGVIFESKRLYENQVSTWIQSTLKAKNYQIAPKASQMLVEFLGTDLGKIDNELEKLRLICPEGTNINPEIIEENIGISKDFNNFELRKAIGMRDDLKAHRIINYFSQNPKDNPMVVTVSLLYGFFSQLQQYHALGDKSKMNVAKVLKVNPYFVSDYTTAAKNYNMKHVSRAISYLREADVQSKGVGAANVAQGDLLKELLVKVMR